MGWIDLIDIVGDVATRKWKRRVAVLFALCLVLAPSLAMRPVNWYAKERAQQITDTFIHMTELVPAPTRPPEWNRR